MATSHSDIAILQLDLDSGWFIETRFTNEERKLNRLNELIAYESKRRNDLNNEIRTGKYYEMNFYPNLSQCFVFLITYVIRNEKK